MKSTNRKTENDEKNKAFKFMKSNDESKYGRNFDCRMGPIKRHT